MCGFYFTHCGTTPTININYAWFVAGLMIQFAMLDWKTAAMYM